MSDIFDRSFLDSVKERAGSILAKKDMKKERHEKILTDEEVFQDFQHNVNHPFMAVLMDDAEKCLKSNKAFVVYKRIAVLTENDKSDASYIYHNDGDTWRASGNALVGKYLKEIYPGLYSPGQKLGVKGIQQLLDAYPGHFADIREALRIRAIKGEDEQ